MVALDGDADIGHVTEAALKLIEFLQQAALNTGLKTVVMTESQVERQAEQWLGRFWAEPEERGHVT